MHWLFGLLELVLFASRFVVWRVCFRGLVDYRTWLSVGREGGREGGAVPVVSWLANWLSRRPGLLVTVELQQVACSCWSWAGWLRCLDDALLGR